MENLNGVCSKIKILLLAIYKLLYEADQNKDQNRVDSLKP